MSLVNFQIIGDFYNLRLLILSFHNTFLQSLQNLCLIKIFLNLFINCFNFTVVKLKVYLIYKFINTYEKYASAINLHNLCPLQFQNLMMLTSLCSVLEFFSIFLDELFHTFWASIPFLLFSHLPKPWSPKTLLLRSWFPKKIVTL